MANPVTHIVLALQMLNLLPPTVDHQAFIVGTSFPDIRYMAKLTREQTHIEPVSWEDVMQEPSSFRAGMLFHNLVDNIRIERLEHYFYDRNNRQQEPIYIKLFPLMQKTAEDAYLYVKTDRWKEIASYFDTIYQEELDFDVPEGVLREWHEMIQKYISDPISTDSIAQFVANNCDIYHNVAQFDPCKAFNELLQTVRFQEKMEMFYRNLPQYMLEYGTEEYKDCVPEIILSVPVI